MIAIGIGAIAMLFTFKFNPQHHYMRFAGVVFSGLVALNFGIYLTAGRLELDISESHFIVSVALVVLLIVLV